ncbi:hypothetical protein jhhlp_007744 [Lomentospora prolificans]|uniref:Glycolipid transfer protein domain-containing protein n=1 Tax=Lomentospora prolificans TaxID=41688 RepID=A0A2N3N0G2_9PEZI|nr:hypothetical protein jhhlp_007744 [Lomentospora prolificans]
MAAVQAIPPGKTLVDVFKRSFTDVPIDAANGNAISTSEFLEAAESLTYMFDILGSVAFSPVKKDMLHNVQVRSSAITPTALPAPGESENIQDLCRNELKTKKHTATEGLLWLVRGLDFTCRALALNLKNSNEELADSFRASYTETLKPFHSFLVKPIFSAAMSACPYRKDFYIKMGDDQAKVEEDLKAYVAALEKIVAILQAFLASKEAKW